MKPTYSIEAPDQQRLKIARLEIEALLKKHDLAGVVVLHTPGMSEFFYDIRPSYSCAWVDESVPMLRVKSKLTDYGGDARLQLHDQAATANMAASIADNLAQAAAMFGQIERVLTHSLRATHTLGTLMSDPAESKPQ